MELTRKQAIDLSVKIWEELADTGASNKYEVAAKYGSFRFACPLCEFAGGGWGADCRSCPYQQEYGFCDEDCKPYGLWAGCGGDKSEHAKALLAQLLYLRHKYSNPKPTPAPKFKVGDIVVGVRSYATGLASSPVSEVISAATLGWYNGEEPYLYRVGNTNYPGYMLELAPEEEWVDVTGECDVILIHYPSGSYVSLSHNDKWIMQVGADRVRTYSGPDYKVEDTGAGHDIRYFNVKKRV